MLTVAFERVAAAPGAAPRPPRSGAAAAPLPPGHAHSAIMFGGYTEQTVDGSVQRAPSSEAWLFSRADGGRWSPVRYASDAPVPQPRLVGQAVVVGDKLWLIGGWNSSVSGPAAFLSDVWTLDLGSYEWRQQALAGEELAGVSRFQAVAHGSCIIIHTHRCDDHVLALHTDEQPPRLEKVPVSGPAPSSRGLHSLVKVGGALFVYGGAPQNGPMLDDVWKLDLAGWPSQLAWQRLAPAGSTPHARCSAAAAAVDDRHLVIVGGAFYGSSGGLEMLSDVHVLDTQANAWLQPAIEGDVPAGRNAAVMVPLPGAGGEAELLLSGGWAAFVETFSDSFIVRVKR